MREQFSNKKFLKLFATKDPCPLSLYDNMVFSYLSWQDRYATCPTVATIARHTGINRNTVSEALGRLADKALYLNDKVAHPSYLKDWYRLKAKAEGEHFSHKVGGFICYVRAPASSLSVCACAVYSYLVSCVVSDYAPPAGWSDAYISAVLKIARATVTSSLEDLHKLKFLVRDGNNLNLYGRLNPTQLASFADAGGSEAPQQGGQLRLLDAPPDDEAGLRQTGGSAILTPEQEDFLAYLDSELRTKLEGEGHEQAITKIIQSHREKGPFHQRRHWEGYCAHLVEQFRKVFAPTAELP